MTRPTDEQIKALRKGDVVTVRATVTDKPIREGALVIVNFSGAKDAGTDVYVAGADITTIEPRRVKVGDRVRGRHYEGEVKAVCDGRVWVRYDTFDGAKGEAFMSDAAESKLTVIT